MSGHNTDGPGFLAHLTELGISTHKKTMALLGSGGAARAIISVLCLLPERPSQIRIFDIDQGKTQQLLSDLKQRLDISIVKVVSSIADLKIQKADILINATPVGMKESDPLLVDYKVFHKNMFVYDLIYNPSETKLLKEAKKQGAQTSNGLGLLYYQGVLSFEHWASAELDNTVKEKMRQSLIQRLAK